MNLIGESSEKIVAHLHELRRKERGLLVEFLRCLEELERRSALLAMGFSSSFVFCTNYLGLNKGSAYRRTHGARLLGRFPLAAEYLTDGRLSLTTFVLLENVLDGDGRVVLDRAAGKSEEDVKLLVASMRPQEAPAELFRRLPNVKQVQVPAEPLVERIFSGNVSSARAPARSRDRIDPISDEKRILRVTVSKEFADDLARVKAALSHQISDGNLEKVLHACLKQVLQAVDRRRKGSGKGRDGSTTGRYVPVDDRRDVWERGGEACAYVSDDGRRCGSTHQLELHHIDPFARGGPSSADNLMVVCRRHNAFHAARDFP